MSALRVLVVDPHPLFRAAAARLLAGDPQIRVVACVPSGPEALRHAAELQPDVVVTDVVLPGDPAGAAVERLKSLPRPPHVVVLSFHDQAAYRDCARSAGADAFLSKAEAGAQLLPLLHTFGT